MFIVLVSVEVKPECVDAFIDATLANASESIHEPGIARFDVMQDAERPECFKLMEVYRTKEDTLRHKETRQYQVWKEMVEDMMAAPRTKQILVNRFPDEAGWD